MSGAENMRAVLNASGAYSLDGEGLIDMELAAYGAGLGPVEEGLGRLEQDMFALTAGSERLGKIETLYRRQASWADLDTRRKGAAKALGLRGGPLVWEDMEGVLLAAGISGSARLEAGKVVIHADSYQGVTAAEAGRLLGRIMPLQVKWEIEA